MASPTGKRFQFVWWGWRRWDFGFYGGYPKRDDDKHGCIYKWRLWLGPLHIRRWA